MSSSGQFFPGGPRHPACAGDPSSRTFPLPCPPGYGRLDLWQPPLLPPRRRALPRPVAAALRTGGRALTARRAKGRPRVYSLSEAFDGPTLTPLVFINTGSSYSSGGQPEGQLASYWKRPSPMISGSTHQQSNTPAGTSNALRPWTTTSSCSPCGSLASSRQKSVPPPAARCAHNRRPTGWPGSPGLYQIPRPSLIVSFAAFNGRIRFSGTGGSCLPAAALLEEAAVKFGRVDVGVTRSRTL